MKIPVVCARCGAGAERWPSEIRDASIFFCSIPCRKEHDRKSVAKGRSTRIANLQKTAVERFWSKVDRRGPDDCWEWQAYRAPNGYGHHSWGRRGNQMYVHRIAMALTDGNWTSPLQVCHTCDNRACCNPAHLWRGTNAENLADMRAKGRDNPPAGEAHPHAKLTTADIVAIRASQEPNWILAERFGVARPVISMIKHRKRWKHVL